MKTILKRIVPERTRPFLRRLWNRVQFAGTSRFCPVCRSVLRCFLPHGLPVEDEALCPICRSKAPHRLACLYFRLNPVCFRRDGVLLHVAPEPELGRRLRQWSCRHRMEYRCGGLNGNGDQHIDVRDLPFANGTIDLIYCCHVLNCMQEDRIAMAEFRRVLHPRGRAFLQVPAFYNGETTLETHTAQERLRAFQDDGIYRCYTDKDYTSRLESAGFLVERFCATSLPAQVIRRFSLKREVLHICRQP